MKKPNWRRLFMHHLEEEEEPGTLVGSTIDSVPMHDSEKQRMTVPLDGMIL